MKSWNYRLRMIGAVLLACVSVSTFSYVGYMQWRSQHRMSMIAQHAYLNAEAKFSEKQQAEIVNDAKTYNRNLALRGQHVFGEKDAESGSTSRSASDTEYQSQLNMTEDGIMARLRIPRISVDMPVFHGTDETSLNNGAGHLYGTSLPVPGTDTNAVISAHSGRMDAAMFMRLGELRPGDFVYIQTFGKTYGYVLNKRYTVMPDDETPYRIIERESRLTLMTCWPIGINTQRLIVTGYNAPIPEIVPEIERAQNDVHWLWLCLLPAVV
ncbi:class C sortase, partial [Bifidobacterium aquikefiri]